MLYSQAMRRRPSSRLLILDPDGRVLLFHFVHQSGPLASQQYWATPGGGLEAGETFAEAARRELFEETGIVIGVLGEPVADREFVLQLADGEQVIADERFFVVRVDRPAISRDRWSALEVDVMADHRWWSADELNATTEVVYPEELAAILRDLAT